MSSKSARKRLIITIIVLIIIACLIGFRIIDGIILNLLQHVPFPLTMVMIAFSILDINSRNEGENDFEKSVRKCLNLFAFSIIFLALVIFINLYSEGETELDLSVLIAITILSFAMYLVTILNKIPYQGSLDDSIKRILSSPYTRNKEYINTIWIGCLSLLILIFFCFCCLH